MGAVAALAPPSRRREFLFTEEDFQTIRGMVREHTGIALSEAKRDLVYSRLARRIRARGLTSFAEYLEILRDEGEEEFEQFTNAITTNLTSFFREAHHFDFLAEELLPSLMERKRERVIRIWSAGCSTGEEPYSIAMTAAEVVPPEWDVRILATDIDSSVLERAARGVYALDRVESLPLERKKRWFLRGRGSNQGMVRVAPLLRRMVSFRQLNLMESWPLKGPLDMIFCRNVLIYFDKPTQAMVVNRFAELLPGGHHLFLGHSETLHSVTDRFRLIGKTIYSREK